MILALSVCGGLCGIVVACTLKVLLPVVSACVRACERVGSACMRELMRRDRLCLPSCKDLQLEFTHFRSIGGRLPASDPSADPLVTCRFEGDKQNMGRTRLEGHM